MAGIGDSPADAAAAAAGLTYNEPPKIVEGMPFLSPLHDYMGLRTPLARMAFYGVVSSTVLFMVQPRFAFDENGPRPWQALSPNASRATAVPWYLVAFGVGALVSQLT